MRWSAEGAARAINGRAFLERLVSTKCAYDEEYYRTNLAVPARSASLASTSTVAEEAAAAGARIGGAAVEDGTAHPVAIERRGDGAGAVAADDDDDDDNDNDNDNNNDNDNKNDRIFTSQAHNSGGDICPARILQPIRRRRSRYNIIVVAVGIGIGSKLSPVKATMTTTTATTMTTTENTISEAARCR